MLPQIRVTATEGTATEGTALRRQQTQHNSNSHSINSTMSESMRLKVVEEILATEKTYMKQLDTLEKVRRRRRRREKK